MHKTKSVLPLLVVLLFSCTVPHYIWPQKDIGFHEINRADLDERVLIASRDSEFKRAIIAKISTEFQGQPVYLKIIGIADLPKEDATRYSAVLLINTCMAWTIDTTVAQFVDRYGHLASIIVLTTSDSGDVLPDIENRKIDAMSSASTPADADPLANEIIERIKKRLQGVETQ